MTAGATQPVNGGNSGQYADIHGLKLYYEIHGTGRPLVLLPGGLSTIGTSFGKVLPGLTRGRQVIAIEQQAHGHTADIDRPLTYGQMAQDTIALLAHLGITEADFFGYSIGGGVALDIAITTPTLVRKLIVATPVTNVEGFHPGVLAGIEMLSPELMAGSPFAEDYARTAPRPADWPILIDKTKQLDREFIGWPVEAIQSIKVPTLLIAGDADIVRPEHVVEVFRQLGGGGVGPDGGLPAAQLAIFPGTTHITLVDRAEWLVPMIAEFLDGTPA